MTGWKRTIRLALAGAALALAATAAAAQEATPLHLAAARGQEEEARRLLAAGANPDAAAERGLTPLHQAAMRGHDAVARVLLEAGANPDAKDSEYGLAPLHWAAGFGHRPSRQHDRHPPRRKADRQAAGRRRPRLQMDLRKSLQAGHSPQRSGLPRQDRPRDAVRGGGHPGRWRIRVQGRVRTRVPEARHRPPGAPAAIPEAQRERRANRRNMAIRIPRMLGDPRRHRQDQPPHRRLRRRVQPRRATPLPRLRNARSIPEGRIMQRTPRNGNTHSQKQRTRRTERSAGKRSEPPMPTTRRQPNRPTGSAKDSEPSGCIPFFVVRRLRRGRPSNQGSRPSGCCRCSIRRRAGRWRPPSTSGIPPA